VVNVGIVWLCGEGGLEEDLKDFYGIPYICSWEFEWKILLQKCVM
jgi:hypothetical protein